MQKSGVEYPISKAFAPTGYPKAHRSAVNTASDSGQQKGEEAKAADESGFPAVEAGQHPSSSDISPEQIKKTCLEAYIKGGVAASVAALLVLFFLTPLTVLELLGTLNATKGNATEDFALENSAVMALFPVIIGLVFFPKAWYVLGKSYKDYFQKGAETQSVTGSKLILPILKFSADAVSPLAFASGAGLGNVALRSPKALPSLPEDMPAVLFFIGGLAALLAELFAGALDQEGIAKHFTKPGPWEIVILFFVTINLVAAAETHNYGDRPEVAQGISASLNLLLGASLVVIACELFKGPDSALKPRASQSRSSLVATPLAGSELTDPLLREADPEATPQGQSNS
jgi:hypothetical protein